MEKYIGRPADESGRLEKERRCYDLLERLGIPFERADHDAANTIADCKAVEQCLETEICKNLFLCNRQKTAFYLLLMRGDKSFKTKDLSHQLGIARLSFAGPEELQELLDLTPGSVTVLGLMNDRQGRVQLVIDRSVAEQEFWGCHPCINTSTLRLRAQDILERFLPETGHNPIFVDLPEQEDV